MHIISTAELRKILRERLIPLFDVRGDVEFQAGHIPGAKTAPLGSLVFRVARLMNPDSFVVVYSAGGECNLAAEAARRLENLGLRNVHCYRDGLAGWRAAGYHVVPSVKPKRDTEGEVQDCRPYFNNRADAGSGKPDGTGC